MKHSEVHKALTKYWCHGIISGIMVRLIAGFSLLALLKVIDWTIGLRVSDEEEMLGLDLSQHEESGYQL